MEKNKWRLSGITRLFTLVKPQAKQTALSEGQYSDREITKKGEDEFSSQDYAKVLAKRAANADAPLTIGLYGSWGSGKSSLMNLTKAELPKKNDAGGRVEYISINVWQLSKQEEVWSAFLQELINQVHGEMFISRRYLFDLKLLVRRIDWRNIVSQLAAVSFRLVIAIFPMMLILFYAWYEKISILDLAQKGDIDLRSILESGIGLAGLGGTLGSVGLFLRLLIKPAYEATRKNFSLDLKAMLKEVPYETQVTALGQVESLFECLVKTWVGRKGRLVVFIDDLDRCTPGNVPEVLEAIKLFTTSKLCVYILGMDFDIVRQGIAKKYKFSPKEAAGYIEKIIQIPFHLPPMGKNKIEMFIKKIHPSLKEICEDAPQIFSKGLESNPRKVKRALNIYRTLWDLANERADNWEMDPVEAELVAKIVIIQNRFRPLYQHLLQDPNFLLKLEKAAEEGNLNLKAPSATKGRENGGQNQKAVSSTKETENGDLNQEVVSATEGTKSRDLDQKATSDTVGIVTTLIAKPAAKGSEAKPGLIETARLEGLQDLLCAGEHRFNYNPELITNYIFLLATTEGSYEWVEPSSQERDTFLGGQRDNIKSLVNEILKRGNTETDRLHIKQTYTKRLERVLEAAGRYEASQQDSAYIGLLLLELSRVDVKEKSIKARFEEALSAAKKDRDKAKNIVQKAISEGAIQIEKEDEPSDFELIRWLQYILRLILDGTDFYGRNHIIDVNQAIDLLEGVKRQSFEPEMVRVPSGIYLMGFKDEKIENYKKEKDLGVDEERRQNRIKVPAYFISRYPVTNIEYQFFLKETSDHKSPWNWKNGDYPENKGKHPITDISWYDALSYCKWLKEKTQQAYRLPTEVEWEIAARGMDARVYPWGNEFEVTKLNFAKSGKFGTTPVGDYCPDGDSPYGIADMAGNVWEWTQTLFNSLPYDPLDGREDIEAEGLRVLRGGSCYDTAENLRSNQRHKEDPDTRSSSIGFRIARDYH